MRTLCYLLAACVLLLATAATAHAGGHGPDPRHPHGGPPGQLKKLLVIGHRGASGYRPEHTLASYRLAAEQGADFIEPDLVSTKDGVLVARHENEIGGTTDVADHPEFAGRKTTKVIDGVSLTGWFTEDFTLAELKTLRAKERIPDIRPANVAFNGQFEIPTFQEVLDLRAQLSRELRRPIGVYPETKHPTYFRSIGLPLEPGLIKTLTINGLNRPGAPVFVQSFDTNLPALDRWLRVPLVQLLPMTFNPQPLPQIARYADGVGPSKDLVTKAFVDEAHANGLLVHPYTFRREAQFLTPGAPDVVTEIRNYLALGIDGFFTDNPDLGVQAVRGS